MEFLLVLCNVLFCLNLFTEAFDEIDKTTNRIMNWFEGVELKLQCSNNEVFVKALEKRHLFPSETDRSGDDYNIWTVKPDKFFENQCFTTAFVGASLSWPVSYLFTYF